MERIGIAASKMAKGNIVLYNVYVILISILFSLFVFIIAGFSVLFALILIAYVGDEVLPLDFDKSWWSVLGICMMSLSIIIGLFNLFAIIKNIKFPNLPKNTQDL